MKSALLERLSKEKPAHEKDEGKILYSGDRGDFENTVYVRVIQNALPNIFWVKVETRS